MPATPARGAGRRRTIATGAVSDDECEETASATDVPGSRPAAGFRVASAQVAAPAASRYDRGEEIARGGLGRITVAFDRTLQRQVAIKELHQPSPRGLQRFLREALITARLQHPAIVPIIDAGTWESGDPYLVMTLLDGKTLSAELEARRTLAERIALLPNLVAIADALGFAHAADVVHRDVKPANIMTGAHGETVLLDWGIAHDGGPSGDGGGDAGAPATAHEALTVAGELTGTIRFMSPEQARGEPAVPGFVVYSLGVTIASVLSGELPFPKLAQVEILERLYGDERLVPVLPADTPEDLAAIVAKATAAPAQRYASGAELAADLRAFVAGQLVGARRYNTRELIARWIRRHRVAVAIAGAAVAAIATTVAVAVTSVVHERDVAVVERETARARERALILVQARAALATDPTAAIAWLHDYPAAAPGQDEVAMLIDEAASRGVARQVWRDRSATEDIAFADDDALVIGHRDGSIERAIAATGARLPVANLGAPVLDVRPTAAGIGALAGDGRVVRWTPGGGLVELGHVAFPTRPDGLFRISAAGDLKVTFVDGEAAYVGSASPPRLPEHAYDDDESNARGVYVVTAGGEIDLVDQTPRRVAQLAPRTWISQSEDGSRFVALAPSDDGGATVFLGNARGDAPVEIATLRACATGEDRAVGAEIADDGSVVAVRRCGVLQAFAIATRAPIAIAAPDRADIYQLSADGRWLIVGHDDVVEVHDVHTGVARELAVGSQLDAARLSRDGRWLATVGEQDVRMWALASVPAGALADVAEPVRLYPSSRPGELVVRQHLVCARWDTASRRTVARVTAPSIATAQLDDDDAAWAWDGDDSGDACIFAGTDGDAVAVGRSSGEAGALDRPSAPPDGGAARPGEAGAFGDSVQHALRSTDRLLGCAFAGDAKTATCYSDAAVATFAIGTQQAVDTHPLDGTVRGIARSGGDLVALVERGTACSLVTHVQRRDREVVVQLPGGTDCRSLRTSGGALTVGRSGRLAAWSAALGAAVVLPGYGGPVEVSSDGGAAAVARDRGIDVVDLHSFAVRSLMPGHRHAITGLAWSPGGALASSDGDTVRVTSPDGRVRVVATGRVIALVWSRDGRVLYTSDGQSIAEHAIDALPGDADRDALTTARIVDGRVETP